MARADLKFNGSGRRKCNRRIKLAGAIYAMTQRAHRLMREGKLNPFERRQAVLGGYGYLYFLMAFYHFASAWIMWLLAVFSADARTQLQKVGVIHIPGDAVSRRLAKFLRRVAPTKLGSSGSTNVDGRAQVNVPCASIMKQHLIALLLELRPDFKVWSDFHYTFKFLTLLLKSKTQDWHQDFIGWRQGLAGVFYLDDGAGSTQFMAGSHKKGYTLPEDVDMTLDDHPAFTKFDVKSGDIVLFHPNIVHRGVSTGRVRRAIYFSVSALVDNVAPFGETTSVEGTQPFSRSFSYNQDSEFMGKRITAKALPVAVPY